ncbi:hypothetical protein IMZ48_03975 [Candidatus Bathyarchaeota archaeon]|nr:hypothetical protein [Candidatus Bathyarchaeota archaeon]
MTWTFGHGGDIVQIVNTRNSRKAARPLRFHSKQSLSPRAIHDARRLLWTEMDGQGNATRLSAIEAFFLPNRLCGLRFVYGTVERTVGEFRGEYRVIHLAPTETIAVMDVLPGGNVLAVRGSL